MAEQPNFETRVKNLSAEEKARLVTKIEQEAIHNEIEYRGCARCVLRALQQNLGVGGSDAFRASIGLSGGVARNCEVCGALLGGLMAVGVAYGSDKLSFSQGEYVKGKEEDEEATQRHREVMNRSTIICDRFREKFGGLRCVDAQKVIHGKVRDFKDPKQIEEFAQPEIHDKCSQVTGIVARIAAEVILG